MIPLDVSVSEIGPMFSTLLTRSMFVASSALACVVSLFALLQSYVQGALEGVIDR